MIIVLDTGVLGGITNPNARSVDVKAMKVWATTMRTAGHVFAIPAIADYELRRELLRKGAANSVTALDTFCNTVSNQYLPISDSVLHRAAQLWATSRNAGKPTSQEAALDGDVILCAQVLEAGYSESEYTVATTNVKHLQQFVNVAEWHTITI